MPDLWNYFKNLFRQAENSSPSQPLIHELIVRSPEEKADYDQWKSTLVCRRLKDWLNDQYAIFQVLPEDIDEALDFLNTPSSKGFVIHFNKTRYSKREVVHFFDYLKEQVLALSYKTQVSDLRTYQRPAWVETVQRHYLKPRSGQDEAGKFKQRFGNVLIELVLRDEQVHHLRFRATAYNDHLYQDAEEFKSLMMGILE